MSNFFENIKGQDLVCKSLQAQLDSNKFFHAYLFIGNAGCGKLDCAKAFAKSLEGDNFANQIENDVHPDVRIYNPHGASTYLVDQIKEIVADTNLAPMQAKYKIYIIRDAEKLGTSAANAFLKTLEEPQINVCFILLANNENNVLPTIVSRCQVINFKSLPYEDLVKYVAIESGCALDDSKTAIDLFGGNTKEAIHFCQDQNLMDLHSEIIYTLDQIDNFTDWELLQKGSDIVEKINEIIDIYKQDLALKTDELSDILENSAITLIKKQNTRNVQSRQNDLLHVFCSSIKLYLRNKIETIYKSDNLIHTINVVSKIEEDLSYNINMQNFVDVVLLNVKHKGL